MTAYSNAFPTDLSPLNPNGFTFNVSRLPDTTFFIQSVNLPGLNLGEFMQANPLIQNPIPGEMLTYQDLSVEFQVDANMINWKAIHDWMIGLGYPESHKQYLSYLTADEKAKISEISQNYSDATLQVLSGQNTPVKTFTFVDCFPTSLDPIQFESKMQDVMMVSARATFKFAYYQVS
jgi:hypothetical protein